MAFGLNKNVFEGQKSMATNNQLNNENHKCSGLQCNREKRHNNDDDYDDKDDDDDNDVIII